eukprot:Pompholyxophrys_punicea_v1_NODE_123_length_3345_cov_12.350334.p2 type:complete len:142 gc:universal NODE_123_length_3345_cov_12.350334:2519-2944(+)
MQYPTKFTSNLQTLLQQLRNQIKTTNNNTTRNTPLIIPYFSSQHSQLYKHIRNINLITSLNKLLPFSRLHNFNTYQQLSTPVQTHINTNTYQHTHTIYSLSNNQTHHHNQYTPTSYFQIFKNNFTQHLPLSPRLSPSTIHY